MAVSTDPRATGVMPPVGLPETDDPAAGVDIGYLYTNDVGGRTELMYKDDTGVETQITSLGTVGGGSGAFTTLGVGTTIAGAEVFAVDADKTIASGASATWNGVNVKAATATISGVTNITTAAGFNLVNVEAPALVGTVTVTSAATVYVAGPPTISGGGAITNPYALWVDSGNARFDGVVLLSDGTAAAPSAAFQTAPTYGYFWSTSATRVGITANGSYRAAFATGGFVLRSDCSLFFQSGTTENAGIDTNLSRDGVSILGAHNGTTNSGQFNVWNTRTSASVGEWVETSWSSNTAVIRTNAAGGGTVRTLQLRYGGTTSDAISIAASVSNGVTLASASTGTGSNIYAVAIMPLFSGTSGTKTSLQIGVGNGPQPVGSSTMDWRAICVDPTINYAGGGAGRVQLLRFSPINTALPTGTNGAIVLSSTASNGLGGIHLYDSTDEVTDVRRGVWRWATSVLEFGAEKLNAGTLLPLKLLGANVGIAGSTFGTNAVGVLAVYNGTAPTTGPADSVQFYSSDDAAGHTVPSFFCEGTNVLATGQADSVSSVRVKMRINGTVVTLLGI